MNSSNYCAMNCTRNENMTFRTGKERKKGSKSVPLFLEIDICIYPKIAIRIKSMRMPYVFDWWRDVSIFRKFNSVKSHAKKRQPFNRLIYNRMKTKQREKESTTDQTVGEKWKSDELRWCDIYFICVKSQFIFAANGFIVWRNFIFAASFHAVAK